VDEPKANRPGPSGPRPIRLWLIRRRNGFSSMQMPVVVPQAHHGLFEAVVLVAHDAERGRAANEAARFEHGQSEPSCRQHADEMSVRKDEHVAGLLAGFFENPIGATADLLRRFAVWAAVAEEKPVRILLQDLFR